jgi:hypothetical protein
MMRAGRLLAVTAAIAISAAHADADAHAHADARADACAHARPAHGKRVTLFASLPVPLGDRDASGVSFDASLFGRRWGLVVRWSSDGRASHLYAVARERPLRP